MAVMKTLTNWGILVLPSYTAKVAHKKLYKSLCSGCMSAAKWWDLKENPLHAAYSRIFFSNISFTCQENLPLVLLWEYEYWINGWNFPNGNFYALVRPAVPVLWTSVYVWMCLCFSTHGDGTLETCAGLCSPSPPWIYQEKTFLWRGMWRLCMELW